MRNLFSRRLSREARALCKVISEGWRASILRRLLAFALRRSLPIIAIFLITIGDRYPVVAEVPGQDRSFLNFDLGLSILGETGSRKYLARSFALGAQGGMRWGRWGVLAQVEPVYWRVSKPNGDQEVQGVVNLGVGGDLLSAQGLIRSMFTVGPSILVNAGEIDQPGSVGFYFELRPAGLRWPVAEGWVVGFDPIILSVVAPVLEGIPLIELEYRTTIAGEYLF